MCLVGGTGVPGERSSDTRCQGLATLFPSAAGTEGDTWPRVGAGVC